MRALETSDYRLADKDIDAVTRLCDALDGLPLAIEIVARNSHTSPLRNSSVPWVATSANLETLTRTHIHDIRHFGQPWTGAIDYSPARGDIVPASIRLRRFFEWNDVNSMARLVHFDPIRPLSLWGSRLKVTSFGRYRRRSTPLPALESTKSYAVEKLREDDLRETQT